MTVWDREPHEYDGALKCPRCGITTNGHRYPICASIDPDYGKRYTHEQTCERYRYAVDVCTECANDLGCETEWPNTEWDGGA